MAGLYIGNEPIGKVNIGSFSQNGIDTSEANVTSQDIRNGKIAFNANGKVIGNMADNVSTTTVLNTTRTNYQIPIGYHDGNGKVSIQLQQKQVTPTEEQQIITPSNGKVLSKVIIAATQIGGADTSDATLQSSDQLMEGITAYGHEGKITGTFTLEEQMTDQDNLLDRINEALIGKAAGGTSIDFAYPQPLNPRPIIEWTRPAEWPDLDSITLPTTNTENVVYYTYKKSLITKPFIAIQVTGTNYSVEIGNINNGVFTATESLGAYTSNQTVRRDITDSDPEYFIVKVYGTLTNCVLYADVVKPDSSIATSSIYQPVVECIYYIPSFTKLGTSSNNSYNTLTSYVEHIKIVNMSNKCTSLAYAFQRGYSLQKIEFINCDTSNVSNMGSVFQACGKLETIDLSSFNASQITTMNSAFGSCYMLQHIDFSGWQPEKLVNIGYMFAYCSLLSDESIRQIESWKIKPIMTTSMFQTCCQLKKIDLSNWDMSNVTNMYYTFYDCYNLQQIILPNEPIVLASGDNIGYICNGCRKLEQIDLSMIDVSKATRFIQVFAGCVALKKINIMGWKATNTCTTLAGMFSSCNSLTEIKCDFNSWDVSGITNSSSVFQNCWTLPGTIDLSSWQLTQTTTLASMFQYCYNIEHIKLGNFNSSACTTAATMFDGCRKLKDVNINTINFANVTAINGMFRNCYSLPALDISNMHITSKCTVADGLFNGCSSLKQLDFETIKSWDFSNIPNLSYMFNICTSLTKIDLSNINTTVKLTNISYFAAYCYSLSEFYFSNVNVTGVTTLSNLLMADYALEIIDMSNCDFVKKPTGTVFNYGKTVRIIMPKIYTSYNMSSFVTISHDDLIYLFNNLPTVTTATTITLGSTIKSKLTDSEIAIATAKGWTVA